MVRARFLVTAASVMAAMAFMPTAHAAGKAPAVAPASQATVGGCNWWPAGSSPGSVHVIKTTPAATHTGPAAACDITGHYGYGEVLWIRCKWVNSAGNLWYYSDPTGWIYSAYVDNPTKAIPTCP